MNLIKFTRTGYILSALTFSLGIVGAPQLAYASPAYQFSTMAIIDEDVGDQGGQEDDQYLAKRCFIKIQNNDPKTGEPLGGGTYRVTKTTGEFIGTYVADENGIIMTESLDTGWYLVKQIIAPEGYKLSTNTVTVNTQGHADGSILPAQFWSEKMAGLVIQNVIQETYELLAGCEFAVYNEAGAIIFQGVSSATGMLETGIVEPGLYTVKQLTTMEGYSITQATRTVRVNLNEPTTTVFENTSLTNVRIVLIDNETRNPIPDAVFKVENSNGAIVATVITDADGTALVPNLPLGQYMVKQFSAPDGYVLDGAYQSVTVQTGMDKELTFRNARISGMVIKAVTLNGHSPVAGAVYEIYHENGTLITTATANSTGTVTVTTLPAGRYLVKQVTTPSGYQSTNPTQTVTVTTNDPTTVTFLHQQIANVVISSKDAVSGSAVPHAKYQVRTASGDYVGDYTADSNGLIVLSHLSAGVYTLSQTSVPDGYIKDGTPRAFTVENDKSIKIDLLVNKMAYVVIDNINADTNKPIKGSVFKIMDINKQTIGTYTTDEIGQISVALPSGTYTAVQIDVDDEFKLNSEVLNFVITENQKTSVEIRNEMLTNLRVKVINELTKTGIYNVEVELRDDKQNSLGRFKTDNEGFIYLEDTLNDGRYTLTLVSVPQGYTMDTVARTLTMEKGKTTEYTLSLNGAQGQICITTFAGEDSADMNIWKNTAIAGGSYRIIDASGKLVATISGDNSGNAYTGALPYGTYYIEQATAPAGFMVNPTRVTMTIDSNSETKKLDFYNKASNFRMTVSVRGTYATQAGSTNKHYFSDIKGSATNPMQNFFLNMHIPAQHVEGVQIHTGTFNTNTVYNIEYKTNQNDYRPLASGLSSLSQYSYDIDPVSLALSTGEYVTDVRFVFGNVSAGFTEVTTPALYTKVLQTTNHGTNYTIKAEIGGQIDSNWYVGAGEFTSTATNQFAGNTGGYIYPTVPNVVIPSVQFPTSLPQTGY